MTDSRAPGSLVALCFGALGFGALGLKALGTSLAAGYRCSPPTRGHKRASIERCEHRVEGWVLDDVPVQGSRQP